MSANRSFEEIFISLQNLAELREQEQEENDSSPIKNQIHSCRCGKNEYSMNQANLFI